MQANQNFKQEVDLNQLSQEAVEILKILDEIETRTNDIRKKLMSELKSNEASVHIKLNDV